MRLSATDAASAARDLPNNAAAQRIVAVTIDALRYDQDYGRLRQRQVIIFYACFYQPL